MNTEHNSLFLMANLGSEVSKIFSAQEKNNISMFNMASEKAQSIIQELKSLPDTKNNEEMNILSEVIKDIGSSSPKFIISRDHLESYFLPFAMKFMGV